MITFTPSNPDRPANVGDTLTIDCTGFVGSGAYHWTLFRSPERSGSNRIILSTGAELRGFSEIYQLTESDMGSFLIVEVAALDAKNEKTTLTESYYCAGRTDLGDY